MMTAMSIYVTSPRFKTLLPDRRRALVAAVSTLKGINGMKRSSILVGVTLVLLTLAASAAPAATITVQLVGITFVEQNITIEVGDTVRWEWVSGFHNVESGVVVSGAGVHDGRFRSGDPTSVVGTTYDRVFDQAFLDANPITGNVYPYYCIVHTSVDMVGTITVTCTTNAACADADLCNGTETCQNGTCVSGTALNCDDGNVCTDDSCDAIAGCQNVNDDTNTCDDGEPCTSDDVCSAGTCAGTPGPDCCQIDSDCDDGNVCTDDQCGGGVCTAVANAAACDDGNTCTDGDVCSQEVCSGTAVSGCCNSDADCDDGDAGTLDTCEANICIISVIDPCLADSDCNDGDVCTTDSCDSGICNLAAIDGCCHADADCDDADECTDDVCMDNVCDNTPVDGCPDTGGTSSPCGSLGMITFTLMFMGLMVMRVAPGPSRRRHDGR